MADDVTLPGTGDVVAADEIGGKKFQRIKLIFGPDGTNTGDVSTTNGLPVDLRYVSGVAVNATPVGFQRVSDEPRALFYDPFESLDITNRWAATTAGGGVAAAVSAGRLTLGSGTTNNGYAYLTSQPTFIPAVPGWIGYSFVLKLENAVGNNAVRFWGMGIVSGSVPSSTNPLGTTGNGMGFEVDTSGVLRAVMYSAGSRTVIDNLASYQPADANDHRYIVVYRTDRTDFYIDGLSATQLVATASFQSPAVQVLSCLLLSVAHSTGPGASRAIDCAGLAVWDTAKGNTTISDGVLPFRKATVAKASTPAAATDLPLVVAMHPSTVGYVGGYTPHGSPDAGNPIKVGARSTSSLAGATMVSTNQRTENLSDLDAALLTKPYAPNADILVERISNTNGTDTASTVFGATASARNCITTIAVYNDSTTGGYVDFKDGVGGTILFTLPLPAKGGAVVSFPLPLRQTTANTAFAYDVSAALTTVYISLIGFKSKA